MGQIEAFFGTLGVELTILALAAFLYVAVVRPLWMRFTQRRLPPHL